MSKLKEPIGLAPRYLVLTSYPSIPLAPTPPNTPVTPTRHVPWALVPPNTPVLRPVTTGLPDIEGISFPQLPAPVLANQQNARLGKRAARLEKKKAAAEAEKQSNRRRAAEAREAAYMLLVGLRSPMVFVE